MGTTARTGFVVADTDGVISWWSARAEALMAAVAPLEVP